MKKYLFYPIFLSIISSQPSYCIEKQITNKQSIYININTAMDMAENNSFNLKRAINIKDNAASQKNYSYTEMGPSLSSSASKTWYDQSRQKQNINSSGEANSTTAFSITASQPLTGLISGSLKFSEKYSNLVASEHDISAAKINSRLEGAQAYIFLQQALRTLEAKKSACELAQETASETDILFKTGSEEKTKIDVLQTQAEAAAAREALASAQNDVQNARIQLAKILGIQNTSSIMVTLEKNSHWEQHNPSVPSLQNALEQAQQNRPEIQSALARINVARKQLAENYFQYLPQLSLFTTYSSSTSLFPSPISTNNSVTNELDSGIQLTWNIWDGGVQASQISDKVQATTEASLAKQETDSKVSQDVETALNNLNSAILSLNDAKQSEENYKEAFHLAQTLYKTGDYSAINLINSENKMTAAEVSLANIRSELDLSWMKLQVALGKSPQLQGESI